MSLTGRRPVAIVGGVLLYRYGPLAWVWRALIAFGFGLGTMASLGAVLMLNPLLLVAAVALIGPALFFGLVLVVNAERLEDGSLLVSTLLFVRRTIRPDRLGRPTVRVLYRTLYADLSAPRVWVPVRGGLPLYFDLLGTLPNRQKLLSTLGLRADEITRAR
jgi:hypothetical protein